MIANAPNWRHPLTAEDNVGYKTVFLLLFGLLMSTSLVICSGCSSGLSRSNAAELISKNAKFPKTLKMGHASNLIVLEDEDSLRGNFIPAMKSQGYIDYRGMLTEKGKAATGNWEEQFKNLNYLAETKIYDVPVGKREIIEVTGISELQNPAGAFVEATFTWHWISINDIGLSMKLEQRTFSGKSQFQKFDDGWRVQEIMFRE
jgi:hypothetical protein